MLKQQGVDERRELRNRRKAAEAMAMEEADAVGNWTLASVAVDKSGAEGSYHGVATRTSGSRRGGVVASSSTNKTTYDVRFDSIVMH